MQSNIHFSFISEFSIFLGGNYDSSKLFNFIHTVSWMEQILSLELCIVG